MQLCENAGFDVSDILNKLRHMAFGSGLDINKEEISGNLVSTVWEPTIVKINSITAASETTLLILSIGETIKVAKRRIYKGGFAGNYPGGGRGRPIM
jgi:T-complex protein 1 subunit eta